VMAETDSTYLPILDQSVPTLEEIAFWWYFGGALFPSFLSRTNAVLFVSLAVYLCWIVIARRGVDPRI
jgi:hypothetical protein